MATNSRLPLLLSKALPAGGFRRTRNGETGRWVRSRRAGSDLDQIQLLLGHASIQTNERYSGSRQNLREEVNDRLGLESSGEFSFWHRWAHDIRRRI